MSDFTQSKPASGYRSITSTTSTFPASDRQWRNIALLLAVILCAGALFAPAFPFTSDGAIHAELVRAFSENGAFYIAANGGVEGSPPLLNVSTHAYNELVYPQYPSGYGIVGAPFYAALGMRGLVVLNAISAAFVLLLTYFIAARLYNRQIAQIAVPILAFATFFTNYAFGIWPHMFALFLWVGAAALAVKSSQTPSKPRRIVLIAIAGLVIGFGATVRVDIILAAPAIFIWLRLFARPEDRVSAITFLAALMPGLLAAAALNEIKFGVASPFYYGPKPGPDNLAHYMWLLPVTVLAGTTAIFVNAPKLISRIRKKASAKNLMFGAGGAIMLIGIFWFSHAANYLHSIYVLAVDLQSYNSGYMQPGVEHNKYGHLLFWGYPKRALLQSVPFAVLAMLPMIDMCRGKSVKAHSLAALIICAPICFYALKQWHGGGAYNMRYFLPALPFIAILSAHTLTQIVRVTGSVDRVLILGAVVSGGFLFTILNGLGNSSEALYAPLALYPQLVMAATLAIALLVFSMTKEPHRNLVMAVFLGSITTLSYSAMVNLADESAHEKARAEQNRYASLLAQALPNDALILTTLPVLLPKAIDRGVSVFYVTDGTSEVAVQAINAFEDNQRCVYFHNSLVPKILASAMTAGRINDTAFWAGGPRFADEPKLQLFTLTAQNKACAGI